MRHTEVCRNGIRSFREIRFSESFEPIKRHPRLYSHRGSDYMFIIGVISGLLLGAFVGELSSFVL